MMQNTSKSFLDEYIEKEALWIHDGKPNRPHALLSGGMHSNGFFNSELVMEDPVFLERTAYMMLKLLGQRSFDNLSKVDRVVGPAMGAITIAHELARHIGYRNRRTTLRAYTEKAVDRFGNKLMVFKKTNIRKGETVLACEDVLTTGGSVLLMMDAVIKAGGILLPYVMVIVNRSGLSMIGPYEIIAVIDQPMPKWAPEECPLCKLGSVAIPPKVNENWALLNKQY
jgi:orotate phosphoribosyltransferase